MSDADYDEEEEARKSALNKILRGLDEISEIANALGRMALGFARLNQKDEEENEDE